MKSKVKRAFRPFNSACERLPTVCQSVNIPG